MDQLKSLQIIQKIIQGLIVLSFLLPFSIPSCNNKSLSSVEKKTVRDSSEIADSITASIAPLYNKNGEPVSPDSSFIYKKVHEEIKTQNNNENQDSYSLTSSDGNVLNFDTKAFFSFIRVLLYNDKSYTGLGVIIYQFNVFVFFGVFIPFIFALISIVLLIINFGKTYPLKTIFLLSIIAVPISLIFIISPFQEIQYGFWITLVLWIINGIFVKAIMRISKQMSNQI